MRIFGQLKDEGEVYCVSIRSRSAECEIITFGAAVRALRVRDRYGKLRDVVLGFDDLENYVSHGEHFGAVIGRFANRIGGSSFELNGVRHDLPANDGPNHLHGGPDGFDRRNWTVAEVFDDRVTMSLSDPDGHAGYPGNLKVYVTYELTDTGTAEGDAEASTAEGAGETVLRITYRAACDRDTVCNLTNHAYFDLNGQGSGLIDDHELVINADFYTPTDSANIPTGEVAPVDGTPLDFRTPVPVGARINDPFPQLSDAGGYDKNYVLRNDTYAGWPGEAGTEGPEMTEAGSAVAYESGIRMTVRTDAPGMQLYSGNFITEGLSGKEGAVYHKRSGLCLETQNFPDAPNKPRFPSAVLRAGEVYSTTTEYRFSTI